MSIPIKFRINEQIKNEPIYKNFHFHTWFRIWQMIINILNTVTYIQYGIK